MEKRNELRSSAPLLDAYLSYFETSHTPFTIPGHKQRASNIDDGLGAVVDSDIPLYGGLDEIKLTNQTLKKSEALAADSGAQISLASQLVALLTLIKRLSWLLENLATKLQYLEPLTVLF